MSDIMSKEKRNKLLRKRAYYHNHPEEAVADHITQIQLGNDDFIMKKVEAWEKQHKR